MNRITFSKVYLVRSCREVNPWWWLCHCSSFLKIRCSYSYIKRCGLFETGLLTIAPCTNYGNKIKDETELAIIHKYPLLSIIGSLK